MELTGYETGERIYLSQTSQVWRMIHEPTGEPVIVKSLAGAHPGIRQKEQLRQEYDILCLLEDQQIAHVIRPLDLICEDRIWAIVLQDVGSIALSRSGLAGTLDADSFLGIARPLVRALSRLHDTSVIHCDITPANILIHPDTRDIHLIDFNISIPFSHMDTGFTHPNSLAGTLGYLSPEQTGRVNRSVDFRSDFYGLGATLYELAAGRPPFSAEDPQELVYSHIAQIPARPENSRLPGMIWEIIFKLMAKDPADRYQSGRGIDADLKACRQLMAQGPPYPEFRPGSQDRPAYLRISPTLYGREAEKAILSAQYDAVVSGELRLAAVSGLPGTGKTSLVREILPRLTRDRGMFLCGKYEKLGRSIPYAALGKAMEGFLDILLAEDPDTLDQWRKKLGMALGEVGQVIVDTLPGFEALIGPQPPLAGLGSRETRNRFFFAWRKILKTIVSSDRPLVLFLDDIQWADQGSLEFIRHLVLERPLPHLFLICAYRSNEVDADHPFVQTLDAAGPRAARILPGNLDLLDTRQLLLDSLKPEQGAESEMDTLARLTHAKTMGNPFFIQRFLLALEETGGIRFGDTAWVLDPDRVEALKVTENVARFLAANVERLPDQARDVLDWAACLGKPFSFSFIEGLSALPDLRKGLARCVEARLLVHKADGIYEFVHDRVSLSLYEAMDPDTKAGIHCAIGTRLRRTLAPDQQEARCFEIADHLFRGLALLRDPEDRKALPALSLTAGNRAMASGAFDRALAYFDRAVTLMGEDAWDTCYASALEAGGKAAMCAALCLDYDRAEAAAGQVHAHARNVLDRLPAFEARITVKNNQGDHGRAVEIALEALDHLGVSFPESPDDQAFGRAFSHIMALVGEMDEQELFGDKPGPDSENRAVMAIITMVADAAFHSRPDLMPLLVFTQVRITLTHGICPESSMAFALFGLILCGVVQDIETGVRFGELALRVLDRPDARAFVAKTRMVVHNCILHWKYQNRDNLEHFLAAHHAGLATGDLAFAALTIHAYCYNALFTAMDLDLLHKKMARYEDKIKGLGHQSALSFHQCYFQTVENLLGLEANGNGLSGRIFDTGTRLPELREQGDRTAVFVVHFCHVFLGVLLDNPAQVRRHLPEAKAHLDGVVALIQVPILNFLESLFLLDTWPSVSGKERSALEDQVRENQAQLQAWAGHGPANHSHKYLFIQARYHHIKGMIREAEAFYAQAMAAVQENHYRHEALLIRERRAMFFIQTHRFGLGIKELKNAHDTAARWGARAVAQRIENQYFQYLNHPDDTTANPVGSTMTTSGDFMDTRSMIRAFQAISAQVRLDRLLEEMTRIMIQNAGATRGYFIESRGGDFMIQAGFEDQAITHIMADRPLDRVPDFPRAVVNYVARTGTPVLLESLLEDSRFLRPADRISGRDRSILCVPVLLQGELLAVIYLENAYSRAVFTQGHMEVIQILAGQAAISLEKAQRYETLERRVRDRTRELALANEKLRYLASTDELTTLANRRVFDEVLEKEIKRLEREKESLSLILCDVDYFKPYNDTYGHQMGDTCLAAVAGELAKALRRPGDLAARYGGEEFGIILPRTGFEGARVLSENIRQAVHDLAIPHKVSPAADRVTISLGFATITPRNWCRIKKLIKTADQALYEAKKAGRNRVKGREPEKQTRGRETVRAVPAGISGSGS